MHTGKNIKVIEIISLADFNNPTVSFSLFHSFIYFIWIGLIYYS